MLFRSKSCESCQYYFQRLLHSKHLTQRSKEPPVLPACVSILQCFLHRLLRILPLADLLECIIRHHSLQTLQLQGVTCGHQMIVIDGFDEGLDLAAFCLTCFRHAAGDLRRVAFDTRNEGVRKRMRLGASIQWLNYDDLVARNIRPLFACRRARSLLAAMATFFPAYLPRVIIATRPTLRTGGACESADYFLSDRSRFTTHTSSSLLTVGLVTTGILVAMEFLCGLRISLTRIPLVLGLASLVRLGDRACQVRGKPLFTFWCCLQNLLTLLSHRTSAVKLLL